MGSLGEVFFVDTTFRDGNASLWAGGLPNSQILPYIEDLDAVGYQSYELLATAFFKKMIREMGEDPWYRIRQAAQLSKRTKLRAIVGRSASSFEFMPASISYLYLERLFANGIQEVRISDSSNTAKYWQQRVSDCKKIGLGTVLNIIYTVSPVHSDAYFERKIKEAHLVGPDRICFKDPGGLLTPERTAALCALFLKHTHLPIEFHTHCNTGLGPLCAIEAIKAGVRIINTAMPPLSNGSSNPSVLNVLENARSLGYTTDLDLSRVGRIGEGLFAYAKSKGLSVGAPLEYRESHFTHQVPGGMISNLRHQLSQMNMIDRLDAVLDEIVQVRKDFGYPIMVTPYSQFVGVQATLNVMSGQRYKELSDQTIQYAIGLWGETESQAFDANVKDMIFSSSKAKKLINWTPPELSLGEIREKFGGPSVSDDELILRYLGGNEQFERLSKPPAQPSLGFGRSSSASNSSVATLKERSLGKAEVLSLVHALSQKGDLGKVSITSSDMNLYLSH